MSRAPGGIPLPEGWTEQSGVNIRRNSAIPLDRHQSKCGVLICRRTAYKVGMLRIRIRSKRQQIGANFASRVSPTPYGRRPLPLTLLELAWPDRSAMRLWAFRLARKPGFRALLLSLSAPYGRELLRPIYEQERAPSDSLGTRTIAFPSCSTRGAPLAPSAFNSARAGSTAFAPTGFSPISVVRHILAGTLLVRRLYRAWRQPSPGPACASGLGHAPGRGRESAARTG